MHDGGRPTLFAMGCGSALVDAAEAAGWRVVVGDAGQDAGAQFHAAAATAAMATWLAGNEDDVQTLGEAVRGARAALVVVGDAAAMNDAYEAGATHFLPVSDGEVATVLRYAARYVRRLRGYPPERRGAAAILGTDRVAGWADCRLAAGESVTLVLVALSRLDLANAAHGRSRGDALIGAMAREITAVTERTCGTDAVVERLGGAEFLVALAGPRDRAETVIGELSAALAQPVAIDGTTAVLGSRFGVAHGAPGDAAAALIRQAVEALAAAKGSNGAAVQVAADREPAAAALLAIDLHHAIDRGEIDILFQPQLAIATGRISGVEALARWDHPTLGALGADALFAAAERADLGTALSDHIQQLVLARAAAWPAALAGLRLSLNLTALDVARPGFAALFLHRVDASGFPRDRLTIEITETGLMRDLDAVAALLAELRAAGCRIAIDDFGTGYSSLAYLKALPLDYLKIDKALTVDIAGSTRDRVVVSGVVGMARGLGIETIAEGVETERQRALLAAEGCDYYQGFLLAPPLDKAGLLTLMEGK